MSQGMFTIQFSCRSRSIELNATGELIALLEHCGQKVPEELAELNASDQKFLSEMKTGMLQLLKDGSLETTVFGDYDGEKKLWTLPSSIQSHRRKLVHLLADEVGVPHISHGEGAERRLRDFAPVLTFFGFVEMMGQENRGSDSDSPPPSWRVHLCGQRQMTLTKVGHRWCMFFSEVFLPKVLGRGVQLTTLIQLGGCSSTMIPCPGFISHMIEMHSQTSILWRLVLLAVFANGRCVQRGHNSLWRCFIDHPVCKLEHLAIGSTTNF